LLLTERAKAREKGQAVVGIIVKALILPEGVYPSRDFMLLSTQASQCGALIANLRSVRARTSHGFEPDRGTVRTSTIKRMCALTKLTNAVTGWVEWPMVKKGHAIFQTYNPGPAHAFRREG
jgi:hypothetical protein